MFFRYSSIVVAPITCSSPRASAGFSMFEASIEPSAAPAPTTVCSSSMKTMSCSEFSVISSITRLEALLELAAVLGPGDHPGEVEGDQPLAGQRLGDLVIDDPLGDPLGDRGLPHSGISDQDRIVLCPSREDLDGRLDLVRAADHRIQLALPRLLGQVTAVLIEALGLARGPARRLSLPRRRG